MTDLIASYQLDDIPDPSFAAFRLFVADPKRAIWDGFEHLLRFVAGMPPDEAACQLRLLYDPIFAQGHPQTRLTVRMGLRARHRQVLDCLAFFLTNGPLAQFMHWQQAEMDLHGRMPNAVTYLRRRQEFIDPLVPREHNAYVPERYYACTPLVANDANDLIQLDRTLSGIDEHVTIAVTVAPVDISRERGRHALYLNQIEKINRPWSVRQDAIGSPIGITPAETGTVKTITLTPLHVPDPMAEDVVRGQQDLHRALQRPHLAFSIVVLAKTVAVSKLVGSTLGDGAFADGCYALETTEDSEVVRGLRAAVERCEVDEPEADGVPVEYRAFHRLASTASVSELAGAFRIPVAVSGVPLCIRKNTDPPNLAGPDIVVFGQDCLSTVARSAVRGVKLPTLARHVLTGGCSGSGKTTLDMTTLLALAKAGVPFLVLEFAKTEVRALKRLKGHALEHVRKLAERLEIYTPGRDNISPLRFNPLEIVPGTSQAEHADMLLRVFEAAMPQGGPLQSIMGHAIDRVYATIGTRRTPEVEDLTEAALHVLQGKAYSTETRSDLTGAIETRFGLLTRGLIGGVFRTSECIPSIDHLLASQTVVELDTLAPYPASILTLCLLSAIRTRLRGLPKATRTPRFVILMAEAHRQLRASGTAAPSQDFPDPRAYVVELVCEMLAELRALGVGAIISEQLPARLAPEIISLTETKVAFRLVDRADRDAMAASMLFDATEYEDIARLSPGEAYFYTGGFHEPRKIRTTNLHDQMDLTPPTDEELMEIIHGKVV